jgi:hypothetical protein
MEEGRFSEDLSSFFWQSKHREFFKWIADPQYAALKQQKFSEMWHEALIMFINSDSFSPSDRMRFDSISEMMMGKTIMELSGFTEALGLTYFGWTTQSFEPAMHITVGPGGENSIGPSSVPGLSLASRILRGMIHEKFGDEVKLLNDINAVYAYPEPVVRFILDGTTKMLLLNFKAIWDHIGESGANDNEQNNVVPQAVY